MCGDGCNHPAASPLPHLFSKAEITNPTNPERPSSPPLLNLPQQEKINRQNIARYQQYQQRQSYQNNRRATDTYIPDNGWPQQRHQSILKESWGAQPDYSSVFYIQNPFTYFILYSLAGRPVITGN